jgi:uncharacterized protein (TIGR00369 family)
LLLPARRNARFPRPPAAVSLSRIGRETVLRGDNYFGAAGLGTHPDGSKGAKRTMKPRGKLSKAALARAAERLRHSHPINHFGFQLVKAERGRAVFRMQVLELHKQIHRVVHGGVLAMLADTAGGFAAFLAAPQGARVVTIEMKINFLEGVEKGEIEADARVLRQGRTTSVVDCDVTDEDGRLVSKALMTFSVK